MSKQPRPLQIEIVLTFRSLFANGLTAKDTLNITGAAATVDSYDSSLSPGYPDATTNRGDGGTLGSITFESDITGVDIGNSDIYGYLTTGGSSIDFGNGSVTGEDTPSGVTVDPDRVSYDFDIDLPDVDAPEAGSSAKTDSDTQITTLKSNNNSETLSGGTADSPIEYKLSDFEMGNNSEVTINGHIKMIVTGNVSLNGVTINAGSSLTIYVDGDFSAGQGNTVINNLNPDSDSLVVYGTQSEADVAGGETPQEFKIGGSAKMTAAIYAPNANFNGAAVCNKITLNGGVQFHYDEGLEDFFGGDPTFKIDSWTEIYDKVDRIDFSDMSALDDFEPPDFSTYTDTDPIPKPEPDPSPDPIPDPDPDPIPEPEPDPDPIPEPEPDPSPDPIPDPSPDPIPDPEPDPSPGGGPPGGGPPGQGGTPPGG